jgi:hypothetical protein
VLASNLDPQTIRYMQCATDGETVIGYVTDVAGAFNSYHENIHYTYLVGSDEHHGIGSNGFGNPIVQSIGPAAVTYVRSNPGVSCLGSHWPIGEFLWVRLQGSLLAFALAFIPMMIGTSSLGRSLNRWLQSGASATRQQDPATSKTSPRHRPRS